MTKVTLTDKYAGNWAVLIFLEAEKWAEENCPSFIEAKTIDVSDLSLLYDVCVEYIFQTEEDELLFTIRWGKYI